MKPINELAKNFKLFLKGYAYLFLLVLSLSIIGSIFNACTNESYYETDSTVDRTKELMSFKNSMINASNRLNKNDAQNRLSKDEIAVNFTNLIQPDALTLIKSYGITEAEIINEFGSLDSRKIALTAEAILKAEELIDNGQTLSIFSDEDYQLACVTMMGLNSTYAQSDTIGGCLADAIGITAAFELLEQGVAGLGRKGALKLLRKVGGKALGPVGLALATYDFADCMGWI